MSETMLSDQIEMLRVQLETSLSTPLVLVVSSARGNDGKSLVASGLARSMEDAGYSTLLVLADEQTREGVVSSAREPKSLNEISEFGIAPYLFRPSRDGFRAMFLSSSKLRRAVSRESVGAFAETCRSTYQVTIVEAAGMLTNSLSMLLAITADGVLVTVREGRRVSSDDRQLARVFERENVPFLGVVSVADSAIRSAAANAPPKREVREKGPVVVPAEITSTREGQAV